MTEVRELNPIELRFYNFLGKKESSGKCKDCRYHEVRENPYPNIKIDMKCNYRDFSVDIGYLDIMSCKDFKSFDVVKMSKTKYFFKRLIYYLRFLKLTLRKELFIISDYYFEDICIFYEPNEVIIYENEIEFNNSIFGYNFYKKQFEQIA